MLLRLEGLRGCAAAATALPQPAGGHRGDLGQSREKRWCVICKEFLPKTCWLGKRPTESCMRHGSLNTTELFSCSGGCAMSLDTAWFVRETLFQYVLHAYVSALLCMACDPAEWAHLQTQRFKCCAPECGFVEFKNFHSDMQRRIDSNARNNKKNRVRCKKCEVCKTRGCGKRAKALEH